MDFSLRQLMSEKFCLDCKGCCRFKEPRSPWRPKVYASEDKFFGHEHFEENVLDSQGHVATRAYAEEHGCLFLDSLTNECRVYKARPFECELYPFVFLKDQEGIFLAAHLACPFVQEVQSTELFEKHCQYLKEFFEQATVQAFLKTHVKDITSAHIAPDEVQSLFRILPQ